MKKSETGGECSMYGGDTWCIKEFGVKTRGKEITWKTHA